jgi:hypothetical protein
MADGWYQDPLTERWWDGVAWTDGTRVVGQQVVDGPVVDPAATVPAGWYPDPRAQRRWNGTAWTGETRRVAETATSSARSTSTAAGSSKRPSNVAVLIGLAVVAVLALAVGAIVVVTGDGADSSVAGPPSSLTDADADTDAAGATTPTAPVSETVASAVPSTTVPSTTVPPTTSTTTTTLPPIADHPYFRALARWDEAGAVDMLGNSRVGSPAWSYARNLQQGFRAGASPTGISTVAPIGPDSMEHCIGTTCFVLSEVDTNGDRITSFSVDRSPIDNRVEAWSLGDVSTCWYFGAAQGCPAPNAITMHLTSIYRVPGSTFVSVEVQVGASTPGPVEFTSMSVLDASGLQTDRSAVAEPVRVGRDGVWLMVTGDVDVSSVWEVSIGARYGSSYQVWTLSPGGITAEPSSDATARTYIETLVAGDREVLAQLAGSYVPQLSAKQHDWFEPTTGQYFDWRAILADHTGFRSRWHGAVLMAPYEYSASPSPWYRTLVPAPFPSEGGVRNWCESNGFQWGVTCIARRVDPW